MSEDEAKNWVKDKANQQKVVDRFFADYPPVKMKTSFFMAGIPGAGKTEFVENMTKEVKAMLVPIEHDKLVAYIDGYRPEEYYNYRKAGNKLVTRILDECLKNGYGFVFDGTLSHEGGYRNIDKTFHMGYLVQIIYIVQDAKLAWQLTRDRELTTKRSIEKQGFIDTCNKINSNLANIFKRFKSYRNFSFWTLDKNGITGVSQATSIMYATTMDGTVVEIGNPGQIEKALSATYNVEELD